MSLLAIAPDTPLAEIDLNVVSAHPCPFNDIAPIAAWIFEGTTYRAAAEQAFDRLRSQRCSLVGSLAGLDQIPVYDAEAEVANAYHRAVLEVAAQHLPDFFVRTTAIGAHVLISPDGGVRRLEGGQFWMMGVVPEQGMLEMALFLDDEDRAILARERQATSTVRTPSQSLRL